MGVSEAFNRTYATLASINNDQARTMLLARQQMLQAQMARAEEERTARLFPLQYAAAQEGLTASRTQNQLLGEELTQKRALFPLALQQAQTAAETSSIENARARLMNKAEKYKQALGLGYGEAQIRLGLGSVASEIQKSKAEAAYYDSKAKEAEASAKLLDPVVAQEKSEKLDVKNMVDSILDRAGMRLGVNLPPAVYDDYVNKIQGALGRGKFDLPALAGMMDTEVNNQINMLSMGQQTGDNPMDPLAALGGLSGTLLGGRIPKPSAPNDIVSRLMPVAEPTTATEFKPGELGALTAKRTSSIIERLQASARQQDKAMLVNVMAGLNQFGVKSLSDLYSMPENKLSLFTQTVLSEPLDRLGLE